MGKCITISVAIALIVVSAILGFNQINDTDEQIFRMHIRANSNEETDQNIKLVIRDEFVSYLTPKIENITTKEQAVKLVESEIKNLECIADNVLKKNGFTYKSKVKVCNEYFPERYYGDKQVKQGYYDALICELGEAKGNNWWCVVYPPLCFVDYNTSNDVVYKSKLWEIINKFFSKE